MRCLCLTIALILPVAAGALRWPWWMILVLGVGNVLVYLATNPRTVAKLQAQEGLVLAGGSAMVGSTAACAVLFALGRLLRMI